MPFGVGETGVLPETRKQLPEGLGEADAGPPEPSAVARGAGGRQPLGSSACGPPRVPCESSWVNALGDGARPAPEPQECPWLYPRGWVLGPREGTSVALSPTDLAAS